jgi:hypothetical protein
MSDSIGNAGIPPVGIIGLGRMGSAMAARLSGRGCRVLGRPLGLWRRTEPRPRRSRGARMDEEPMRVAQLPVTWIWLRVLPVAAAIVLAACQVPADPGQPPSGSASPAIAIAPPAGHAHNDYAHARPLLDALSHGFASVEADIHLRDGELFVAHTAKEIVPGRTLQSLYLEPLSERIEKNGGSVYGDGRPLILLIDVKTNAKNTYLALHELLQRFQSILTVYSGQNMRPGPIFAIVSGRRDRRAMEEQGAHYAAYDGRWPDLKPGVPVSLMPLVSYRWPTHFSWRGDGTMPPAERARLDRIVADAHAAGRLVRFWATPDEAGSRRDAIWRTLVEADVDLINTDDLAGLERFLAGYRAR